MITEDYVSLETAKLLKEKGFDLSEFRGKWAIDYDNIPQDVDDSDGEIIVAEWHYPLITLQMAMKWIQEVHNILIVADYDYECTNTSWCFKVYRLGENGKPERVAITGTYYDYSGEHKQIVGYRDYERSYKDYATREEAEDDGIRYVLENYIS